MSSVFLNNPLIGIIIWKYTVRNDGPKTKKRAADGDSGETKMTESWQVCILPSSVQIVHWPTCAITNSIRLQTQPGTERFFQHVSVLNSQHVLRNDVTSYALARVSYRGETQAVFTLRPVRVSDSSEPLASGCVQTANDWPDANSSRTGRRVHTASASQPVVTCTNLWRIQSFPGHVSIVSTMVTITGVNNVSFSWNLERVALSSLGSPPRGWAKASPCRLQVALIFVCTNMIKVFERWCYRRMLRISWTEHFTNEVFNRANTKPTLLDGLPKRRLAFHGHLVRKDGNTLDLMIGRLHGTKPRGRPRTTWLKDLATQANISYKEVITIPRDRKKWRSVGNPRRTPDEWVNKWEPITK